MTPRTAHPAASLLHLSFTKTTEATSEMRSFNPKSHSPCHFSVTSKSHSGNSRHLNQSFNCEGPNDAQSSTESVLHGEILPPDLTIRVAIRITDTRGTDAIVVN